MTPAPQTTLAGGRYQLGEAIGAGAFATVYRAADERLDADVAIKILAENRSFDPDVRDRFINEARLLRRIDSQAVVRCYDLGETDRGQPFLVMELANGGTVADRVEAARRDGYRITLDDVRIVVEVLGAGLMAMHHQRIVHRDLAPRNLYVTSTATGRRSPGLFAPDERLVIGDLGLSKDLAAASGLTAAVGTDGYLPPEQRTGEPVDERGDLWAASAVLVWLLTGSPPDPSGAWTAVDGFPPELRSALNRSLAENPDKRHRDAMAWFEQVQPATAAPSVQRTGEERSTSLSGIDGTGAGGQIDPRTSPTPSATQAIVPAGAGRRWTVVLASAALVAGVAVGGVGARILGDSDPPDATDLVQLADDRVRAEASNGDLGVAIEGPRELQVGEVGRYVAELENEAGWSWTGPDGRLHERVSAITIDAAGPGVARIGLVAVDANGRVATAELEVQVRN